MKYPFKTNVFYLTASLIIIAYPIFFLSTSLASSLVTTAPITRGSIETNQTFVGSLYFNQSSVIASQVEGLVLEINFDTTQGVKKGEILVKLDDEVLRSRIKAVKASLNDMNAQLDKANKDLKRYQRLLKQKNVSQQKYDEFYYTKVGLEQKQLSLQAELEVLQIEHKQRHIRAPFDGFITQRDVDIGEWLSVGGSIGRLTNPLKIHALFDIPAQYATKIQAGKKIDVTINNTNYPGVVAGVILQGDHQSRTFPLKITMLDLAKQAKIQLFEGMEARIKLPGTSINNAFLVPRDAVIKRFGQDVIFINKADKAHMIPVNILLIKDSLAAIEGEGLKQSMSVITKGNERIFHDQAIRPTQQISESFEDDVPLEE